MSKFENGFLSMNEIKEKPRFQGVLSCFFYSLFSLNMTLVNKALFAYFDYKFPIGILFFQYIFTIGLIIIATKWLESIQNGLIGNLTLNIAVIKTWIPVNILFIVMLTTGSYSLNYLTVPMVTIFKNITTTLVAFGDYAFYGQQLSHKILFTILLMVFGSIVAGINDLSFHPLGYCWMIANCLVSAGYVLYLRLASKMMQLTEWNMVFLNNVLSIPFTFPLLLLSGEVETFFSVYQTELPASFYFLALFSGLSGFLLSVCSFWALKKTSPTTYSMVGSLNKIPLTILGFLFFHSPVTLPGGLSIFIGLMGGVLYSYFKQQEYIAKYKLPS